MHDKEKFLRFNQQLKFWFSKDMRDFPRVDGDCWWRTKRFDEKEDLKLKAFCWFYPLKCLFEASINAQLHNSVHSIT